MPETRVTVSARLDLELRFGLFQLMASGRVGRTTDNRTYMIEAAFRYPGDLGLGLYAQYWNGYGESLIDYDK